MKLLNLRRSASASWAWLWVALSVAFLTLALAGALPGTVKDARAAQTRPLLVVGDSLSAEYGLKRGSGWVALLGARLARERIELPIVNASISGETTAGGRSRILDLLVRHQPGWVIVELGGNDALRGLELSGTQANLLEIVQASKKAGAQVVVVGMQVPPNYGRTYARQFAGIFETVARAERVAHVPFLLEGIADRLELFQADRIHPKEVAQERMLENVWVVLRPLLKSGRG